MCLVLLTDNVPVLYLQIFAVDTLGSMVHTSVQVNPTTHTQLRLCAENSIVEELNFSGADWIATLCCEMLPVNENPSIVLVRPR